MNPCQQDRVFEMINGTLKEIKDDVKELRAEVKDLNGFKIKVTAYVSVVFCLFQFIAWIIK